MPHPDSIRIITVIAFILLLIIGMKRTVWLPSAYMILVYTKMSSYFPAIGAIKGELIFALVILTRLLLSENIARKFSFQENPVHKYLIIFTGCVFLSFVVAWDRTYSWDTAVYHYIKVLILYLMVLLAVNTTKDIKLFVWSFILMYVYLVYEPVFGFVSGSGGDHQMYGVNYIAQVGILAGHVGLANNMNQMIPIVFFLLLGMDTVKKKVYACIPLILFITCLIGSGSRGGVLGFLIFGMCAVWFSKQRVKMALIGLSFFLILFLFSNTISSTTKRISPDAGHGRFTGLTHGIEMLKRGNVLGVGPGCFLFARGRYFGYTMESHNIYGQLMGELGIPGSIAWFLFIRHIFINLIKSKKKLKALSMERNFLYYISIGLQVSLIVRLFVCLASHSLFFFYWYVVAPLSFIILKNVEQIETNLQIELEKKNEIA